MNLNLPLNHKTELYQCPQNIPFYPQNPQNPQNPMDTIDPYKSLYPVQNYPGVIPQNDLNNPSKVCYTEKRERRQFQKATVEKLNKDDNQKETEKESKKAKKHESRTINRAKSNDSYEMKFKAFTGRGKQVGQINVNGLNNLKVDKLATPSINRMYPTCKLNIRLFNGEVINTEFNLTHTLRELYYYVRRVSGYNNFSLLEGFPPKSLKDYDRSIAELHLQNTTLTQRIY